MIKPTIGRVVWFWGNSPQTQPMAAIVCYVQNDTMVNLAIFDASGTVHAETSVYLYQGDGERPAGRFAEWMPYQKAVAEGRTAPTLHA